MFFWLILGLLVALILYSHQVLTYWKRKNVPFIPPIPLFGNILPIVTLQKYIGDRFRDFYNATGLPYIGVYIFHQPGILIRDPELIRQVLVTDFRVFNNRGNTQNLKDDPVGSCILPFIKDEAWKKMRGQMSPLFSPNRLRYLFEVLHKVAGEMGQYMDTLPVGEKVDAKDVMNRYTTEAVAYTAFGVKGNCFENDEAEFSRTSNRVLNAQIFERAISQAGYFFAHGLVTFFRLKFIDTESCDFFRAVLKETLKARAKQKYPGNDLIDILLELEGSTDFELLLSQAATFFVAGYETTSTTIVFVLYELGQNKEIQAKLREEVLGVKAKHGGFSYEAINDMKYLEMCVQESFRKYPLVPMLERVASTDYKLPGSDTVIEKGTMFFISSWGLHYDEEYFPDPDRYDPERFANEDLIPPFVFLPFGEGSRNCLAFRYAIIMIKMALAQIVSLFEINSIKQKEGIEFRKQGFFLGPKKKIFCTFRRL